MKRTYTVTGSGIDSPFTNGSIADVIDAIQNMNDGSIIISLDDEND